MLSSQTAENGELIIVDGSRKTDSRSTIRFAADFPPSRSVTIVKFDNSYERSKGSGLWRNGNALAILCPKCHRLFSKELERKEIVSNDIREGVPFTGTRARFVPVEVRKAVVKYNYYYKCKHCQHEWTETKLVEFNA